MTNNKNIQVFRLKNLRIVNRNLKETKRIVIEKFKSEEYKCDIKSKKPLIIDCGAHIGVTSLYFKTLYPNCKIVAFEPDKTNYELFQKNMKLNRISGVKCINAALAKEAGSKIMFTRQESDSPWTWANTIVKGIWGSDNPYNKEVEVESVQLSEFITSKVDLLKLDIEGEETEVLLEIADKLSLVRNIVLEFHGTKYNHSSNSIQTIVTLLIKNGFETTITPVDFSKSSNQEWIKETELEYYIVKATRDYKPR